ncbi:DUF4397 domain-containing protein [Microcella sp.]|uniref:DUF4397 domain-containing protein n=1 Tax=Microcella sp. TaxID=1913979 RepID=UPI00391C0640
MRNRILAGLGVAALATVGVAAPANAVSDTTADVWVVHAVPGLTVDVYLNGALTLEDFEPGTFEAIVDAEPGQYIVDIVAADAAAPAAGTSDITYTATVEAGVSYTLVAQPSESADGNPVTIQPFVNDLDAVGDGEASVTVRHTANAPEVNVVAEGVGALFSGLRNAPDANEQSGAVPAGTYDIAVQVAEGGATAIDLSGTTLAAGTHYFIHAFGPAGGPYSPIVFTISDTPANVPAGSAGLVAENGTDTTALIAGAAALLALLAAAGVVVARRRTASVER